MIVEPIAGRASAEAKVVQEMINAKRSAVKDFIDSSPFQWCNCVGTAELVYYDKYTFESFLAHWNPLLVGKDRNEGIMNKFSVLLLYLLYYESICVSIF